MIFSHKKLLIFKLKPKRPLTFIEAKHIFMLFFGLAVTLCAAQESNLALQKSNDLIFEGNELVNEDFVQAEKEYRKAISKLPSNAVGSYNLGNAYYNSGHLDEALLRHIETTKNASSKKEKHAAFHNIGNILMNKELCKEAVEAFKNALRNDPTDDESRYNLALAKECAKNQGGGEGEDEKEEDKKQDENEDEDQKEEGDKNEDQDSDGDDNEEKKEGDDKEDENGKPSDEKDDKQENSPSDKRKKQQQAQPGKLSPQQVKNLLEAMNNQEKKVQEKINAQKTKGVKVRTEKDW